MPWRCSRCETINADDIEICDVCDADRQDGYVHEPEVAPRDFEPEPEPEQEVEPAPARVRRPSRFISPHLVYGPAPKRRFFGPWRHELRNLAVCLGLSLFVALLIVILRDNVFPFSPKPRSDSDLAKPAAEASDGGTGNGNDMLPAAVAPSKQLSIEESAEALVRQWLEMEKMHDVTELKQLYAPDVVEYNGAMVQTSSLVNAKKELFQKWPHIDDQLVSINHVSMQRPRIFVSFTTKTEMMNGLARRTFETQWLLVATLGTDGRFTVYAESMHPGRAQSEPLTHARHP